MSAIPIPDFVDVSTGGKAGARRDTDRRIAHRIGEAQAPAGQFVEVRCVDDRMAGGTQGPRVVLVRHDEEEIRGHVFTPRASPAAALNLGKCRSLASASSP